MATSGEEFTPNGERPLSDVLESFELSMQEFDELYKKLAK